MKKRYLSLLLLGVGALSLTSCGYGEVTLEEFKNQLTANSEKEAPGFTKGTVKTQIKDYKFECSNADAGKIIEGTLNIALKATLVAQGFKIPDNCDLSKGFNENRDLSAEEVKTLTAVRYSGATIVGEIDTGAKFYRSGDALKISQKEEDKDDGSHNVVEASVYFDEYGYKTGTESSIKMDFTKDKDTFKLSLFASTTYKFSR